MTRTVAVSLCKDEADVVEGWVRHLLDPAAGGGEVDHILIADNGSTDGTRDILWALADDLPITLIDDPDPAYRQSEKMSRLAALAVEELGATWICPIDLDEVWYSRHDRVRVVLEQQPPWVTTVHVALFNHYCTSLDVNDPDPFRSIVWRQPKPAALPKVAFRWQPGGTVVHQGNHGVTLPEPGEVLAGEVELRHFSYRSPDHMVHKARNGAAAYAAAPDLPEDWGRHWKAYGEMIERHGEDALRDWFRTHFWYFSPIDQGLIRDPAPYRRWEIPETD